MAALVAHRHLHEVHLLAERHRFRVSSCGDVAGTVLGTVRKIDSGACPRVFQHRLDACNIHHVADLMAIAENRG